MPSFVITEKCDGCKAQDKTACQYICPHDLMALNRDLMKAYNQDPEQCWEWFNCVKICPQQAIETRGYSDFVPVGSSNIPMRGTDSIMWTIKFRNGILKRFKFPIRTTAEGSVDPYAGKPAPDFADLKKPGFFNGPARKNRRTIYMEKETCTVSYCQKPAVTEEGNHGQFIYISPHKSLIILRFGESYGSFHGSKGWLDMFYSFASNIETP